jgi:hypothetical protein
LNIEESLIRHLLSDGTLTGYVNNRIYFNTFPIDCGYPAIAIQKISSVRQTAFNTDPGLASSRFQFTIYDSDYPELKLISQRINTTSVLKDFVGILGTSGSQVDCTEYINEIELEVDPSYSLYGMACDWLIHYHE